MSGSNNGRSNVIRKMLYDSKCLISIQAERTCMHNMVANCWQFDEKFKSILLKASLKIELTWSMANSVQVCVI